MQQAVGLVGAGVHRHAPPKEVITHFHQFNAQVFYRRVPAVFGEQFDRDRSGPDGHGAGGINR
jgi:hypothetical protein